MTSTPLTDFGADVSADVYELVDCFWIVASDDL